MPIPLEQHMTVVGGANSVNSTIYTSSLIQIGDNIQLGGCVDNDGVYTVVDIVNTLNTGEANGSLFQEATCNTTNGDATVTHDGNTQIIAGLSISGSGIQSDSYVASITDSTTFELSKTANGNGTDVTLTFGDRDIYYVLKGKAITTVGSGGNPKITVRTQTGDKLIALGDVDTANGIDIWSNNAVSNYATKNSGWQAAEINPTTVGSDAKYMYLYADGVLRARNINSVNQTRVKWYGHIQRNQFSLNTGLVSSEWQEHKVSLSPPRINPNSFTFAFGTSSHDNTAAGNYYLEHSASPNKYRGVAIHKQGDRFEAFPATGRKNVFVNGNFSATAELFKFDDGSGNDLTSTARLGEVISIKELSGGVGDLGEYPKEFLFCKKEFHSATGSATYKRAYGGVLPNGTAPFDFGDDETPVIERGVGWNIGVTAVDGGSWGAGTYEFYQTFIYDSNQESLPVQFGSGAATIAAFEVSLEDGQGFKVSVYADLAYSGRITGGRVYAKLKGGEGDLILVQDLDIVKGVRPNLIDNYAPWSFQGDISTSPPTGLGYYHTPASAQNLSPNLDTYESINGFSANLDYVGIGGKNEGYVGLLQIEELSLLI